MISLMSKFPVLLIETVFFSDFRVGDQGHVSTWHFVICSIL